MIKLLDNKITLIADNAVGISCAAVLIFARDGTNEQG
jgi:hypothetical protein